MRRVTRSPGQARRTAPHRLRHAQADIPAGAADTGFGGLPLFPRQHPLPPYTLDFYCDAAKLCIELDGSQHYTEKEEAYDRKRTVFLESYHIQVIRFYNGKINLHFKEACMEIERVIDERIKQLETDS